MSKQSQKAVLGEGKLRIVFATPEFIHPKTLMLLAGGLANYLHKISAVLSQMGHDVHIVIIGSVKKEMDYKGIKLHFIKRRNFLGIRKHRKASNPSAMVIRDFLVKFNRKLKIDIVQYSSFMAMGQYPIKEIASCVRISSYAKLHFGAAGIDGESQQRELFNEQEMFRASKFIFGPSQNTVDFIKNDLNLKVEMRVIETPFAKYEGEQDYSIYEKFLRGKSYVLFFGTLWALKGSVEIADTIYDFLNLYKEMNFVFVGKQNKDKAGNVYPIDEILRNANEHKGRVIYIDSQPHKTLYPIITNAKAVVLPSRYDNFPNTCIEAMSLKKVVLATKNTGFDQMIKDGENGFLCEAYNSKSLLEGLQRIMNADDIEMDRLSQNAYLRILELAPLKAAARLLDYYKYVIDNWRK